MSDPLTCQELYDFLHQYVEDELEAERRAIFEQHLHLCPPCKDYLHSYRKTMDLGRAAFCGPDGQEPPPPEVPEALLRAILAARRKDPT